MPKILIVDDDTTTRLVLTRTLQREGHDVTAVKNGEEGLISARQLHPDLIICDWMMPLMDGLELCRQIKTDPTLSSIFFILLTGREKVSDRVEGLDTGADEFLLKPIDPHELLARVRAGLRQGTLMKELNVANQALMQANERLLARNELLESLSLTDQLTGLLNRRALEQALPHLLPQSSDRDLNARYRYLCLFVIDIDHFKQVNDNYGHLTGDWVLQAIASKLQANIRTNSLLYRYGGEEFICLTPGINPQNAWIYGEFLRSTIAERPIQVSGDLLIPITISIGAAIASEFNQLNDRDLLLQADEALYRAKREGRNRVRLSPHPEFMKNCLIPNPKPSDSGALAQDFAMP